MPDLTLSATLTYGESDSDTSGAVPCREPLSFTLTYTEVSIKEVQIASSTTDESITLDSVGNPKFLLVESTETAVDIKLDDGVTSDPTPSKLAEGEGWIMIANPNGQAINEILVTTPASPSSGARVRVLAFE